MGCRSLLSIFSFILLCLAFYCGCSWASPLSLGEYRAFIQEAISRVESETGPLKSEECAFFDERFPLRHNVNTKSGDPVQLDNGPLLDLLKRARETGQGREALIVYLKALRSQISFVDQAIPLSEERWGESRASLDEVFRAREFQNLEESKDPAWLVFLMDLMNKALEWLERHSGAIGGSGEWLQYVFYGVVLAGALLLVLWILHSLGHVGARFGDLKLKSVQGRKEHRMDWQAFREESRHKGEQAEYREAIRFFFISVLMEGHERGWWVYRREATNREHLITVEAGSGRREALGKMIHLYETAWYGHESQGEESFRQCAEWLRLMEAG